MKRLLIAATLTLAFSATPAMAAPIPHNDDNPDNWGAVYNLDLCNGEPCEFEATSTDLNIVVIQMNGQPMVVDCTSLSATWGLHPGATVFDRITYAVQPVYCNYSPAATNDACVYSPSGFANGSDDIELWIRNGFAASPQGLFAKASDGPVGNYVYRFDSYEFDQQVVTGAPPSTLTIDATFEMDGDPVLVEHDRGATTCSYPELS